MPFDTDMKKICSSTERHILISNKIQFFFRQKSTKTHSTTTATATATATTMKMEWVEKQIVKQTKNDRLNVVVVVWGFGIRLDFLNGGNFKAAAQSWKGFRSRSNKVWFSKMMIGLLAFYCHLFRIKSTDYLNICHFNEFGRRRI